MAREKKKNEVSFRPRTITEAVYELSKADMDIIDILLTQIGDISDIDDNLHYEINVTDYMEYFGLKQDNKSAYRKLEQAVKGLYEKGFTIYGDKSLICYHWVQGAEYVKGEGRIDIEVTTKLKQLLVEVKKSGGSRIYYSLKYSLPMKSQYSKRIYYMCKQWEQETGVRYDNIDKLREQLQVPKTYNYGMFKERVLNKAIEEINEFSDIVISYSEVTENTGKGGRPRIIGITWSIEPKDKSKKRVKQMQGQMSLLEYKPKGRKKNSFDTQEQQDYGNMQEFEQMILANK